MLCVGMSSLLVGHVKDAVQAQGEVPRCGVQRVVRKVGTVPLEVERSISSDVVVAQSLRSIGFKHPGSVVRALTGTGSRMATREEVIKVSPQPLTYSKKISTYSTPSVNSSSNTSKGDFAFRLAGIHDDLVERFVKIGFKNAESPQAQKQRVQQIGFHIGTLNRELGRRCILQ